MLLLSNMETIQTTSSVGAIWVQRMLVATALETAAGLAIVVELMMRLPSSVRACGAFITLDFSMAGHVASAKSDGQQWLPRQRKELGATYGRARLRLHHRRRRIGGMRAGPSPDRICRCPRSAARSRRPRFESADLDPARHGQDARASHARLGIRDRAGAQPEQSPHRGDARQGARRLFVHQCDGLYARPSRRLRPVGAYRRDRLALPRSAYV